MPELMAADVNAILVAREGREEANHELFSAIYGAQGIKLPPLRPEKNDPETVKAGIRRWARDHNRRFAAERTAEAVRARAVARAEAKSTHDAKSG